MIREISDNKDNPFYHKVEYVINNEVVGYLEYALLYERIEIEKEIEEEQSDKKYDTI